MLYYETPQQATQLKKAFSYHPPNREQTDRYEGIRGRALSLAELVCHSCPPSREASLALTKLDEAVMWANSAIVRNEAPNVNQGIQDTAPPSVSKDGVAPSLPSSPT